MKSKIYRIANFLESVGWYKEAGMMDKVAETLPEVHRNTQQAYSVLGFDINNRKNISEEELRSTAKQRIMAAHPDRAEEADKAEANHNTRILIDAMKLAVADLKKYKATGTGLGSDGATNETSDLFEWASKTDTADLDRMKADLINRLHQTKTIYRETKIEQGGNFGEDDSYVVETRQSIAELEKQLSDGGEKIITVTVRHPRDYKRKVLVYVVLDLSTGKPVKIVPKGVPNEQDREFVTGRVQGMDFAYVKDQMREEIKKLEDNILRRKQGILREQKMEKGMEGSVALGPQQFYKTFLENDPSADLANMMIQKGMEVGALRKLLKGARKGMVTMDSNGVFKLERSDDDFYKFMGMVFHYLQRLIGQLQRTSVFGDDAGQARTIADNMTYGQISDEFKNKYRADRDFLQRYHGSPSEYTYSMPEEEKEKHKEYFDLKERSDKLSAIISTRVKGYAHIMAQILRDQGLAEYIPGHDVREDSYSGRLAKKEFDTAKQYIAEGVDLNVDEYREKYEGGKGDADAGMKEKEEHEQREYEERKQQQQREQEQAKEDKEKRFNEMKAKADGEELKPVSIDGFKVEDYNRMTDFYIQRLLMLPEINAGTKTVIMYAQDKLANREDLWGMDRQKEAMNLLIKKVKDWIFKYDGQDKAKEYGVVLEILKEWKRNFDGFRRDKPIRLTPPYVPRQNSAPIAGGESKPAGGTNAGRIIFTKVNGQYGDYWEVSGDTLAPVPGKVGVKAYELVKAQGASWNKFNKSWKLGSGKKDQVESTLRNHGFEVVER